MTGPSLPSSLAHVISFVALALFASIRPAAALDITLEFEEPSVPAPGMQVGISSYSEDGFFIKPLGLIEVATPFRLRRNGGSSMGFPENGSPYLQLALQDSFEMVLMSGATFTPVSIDLAEYSEAFATPKDVLFTGYLSGGGTVSTTFTLDGLIDGTGPVPDFETFLFPVTFADILRLETTTNSFSADNLVVTPVPEPVSAVLILAGLGLLACRRNRNKIT